MESSAKNTAGSSFLSKFDAINALPSSPSNKIRPSIYNFNSVHPYICQETRETQGKHSVNKWNMSFHRNNDSEKINLNPQWYNGENSSMEFNNKDIKSFLFNDVDKKNNKENSSTAGYTSGSFDEAFQDFKPAFTSSPLQMDDNNLSDRRNKIIFNIPAYPKRFEEEFHFNFKTNGEGPKMFQNKNKPQSECDETIKSITASSKVCQLVKQVIDSQNKLESINGNNNQDIVFYLKPECWTQTPNKSQIEKGNKIGNELNDNDENSNKILGFNISIKHNNTTVREKVPELKKTIPENNKLYSSVSSCVSVGSQTGFEHDPIFSENNNVSFKCKSNFMNTNLKNVIKRLKIGVSLYGCDFQVIKINLLLFRIS